MSRFITRTRVAAGVVGCVAALSFPGLASAEPVTPAPVAFDYFASGNTIGVTITKTAETDPCYFGIYAAPTVPNPTIDDLTSPVRTIIGASGATNETLSTSNLPNGSYVAIVQCSVGSTQYRSSYLDAEADENIVIVGPAPTYTLPVAAPTTPSTGGGSSSLNIFGS